MLCFCTTSLTAHLITNIVLPNVHTQTADSIETIETGLYENFVGSMSNEKHTVHTSYVRIT